MTRNEVRTLSQSGRPAESTPPTPCHLLSRPSSVSHCSLHCSYSGLLLICEPESLLRTLPWPPPHSEQRPESSLGARGPAHSARSPPCPHLLPLSPLALCSSPTGLLAAPQTHQARPHFRAFVLAVPSAWSPLASHPHMDTSSCHSGLRFSFTCSERPSLTLSVEELVLFDCLHSTNSNHNRLLHMCLLTVHLLWTICSGQHGQSPS